MIQFEKYLSKELNIVSLAMFQLKLKLNSELKEQFENYKTGNYNLKNMFLINEAEKEIQTNKKLKKLEILTDQFIKQNTDEAEILNFLERTF